MIYLLSFLCGFAADALSVAWFSYAEGQRPRPILAALCSLLWFGVTLVAAREALHDVHAVVVAAIGHGSGTLVSVALKARVRRRDASALAVELVKQRCAAATDLWQRHIKETGRPPSFQYALAISAACGLTAPLVRTRGAA